VPFTRPCRNAEDSSEYRGGDGDWSAICAAAEVRGLAVVYALNDPTTSSCSDSL
jgi:hypothetical protein